MDKRETINLLLYDVALEHSAIVQYLYHIFLITDGNITSEIESIARQEMRHLKWFAQKVVQLGGQVVLDRLEDMINVGGPDWADMLAKDVWAEEEAIRIYSQQLEIVKEDSVKRLLERVIKDEQDHKIEFTELMEKVKEGLLCVPLEEQRPDPKTLEVLNRFLREEYQTVINYLYQFFHAKNCDYKDIMLDLAIESMVHMGKLGEKVGELGGMPDISRLDFSPKPLKSLQEQVKAEILYEQETGGEYEREVGAVQDQGIRRLFSFIEHQEEYHKQKLLEFFKLMNRLTVGDLRKEGQE
ncbi:MAG: ferritin-like domain-containing protein [Aquificaceae bacterium]|nr:ferritin-like domain-containing protein [Aquificaceae bacterium]MDW8294609.1 ferritin-like domain-containing protein [Aquificaceae bacterium]